MYRKEFSAINKIFVILLPPEFLEKLRRNLLLAYHENSI